MELNEQLIIVAAVILSGAAGAGLTAILRRSKAEWITLAEGITPDQFDALASQVVAWAYDGVEQVNRIYGNKTSREKQELAVRWIRDGLAYVTGKKPPRALAQMLLEAFIARRVEAEPAQERWPDGKPAAEALAQESQ